MELLSTIGLLFALFCAFMGLERIVRWAIKGYRQEQREIALGQSCLQVADEVVKDIEVPVLRPQAVR